MRNICHVSQSLADKQYYADVVVAFIVVDPVVVEVVIVPHHYSTWSVII